MKTFKQFISEEEYDRIKDKRAERGGDRPGDGDNPPTRKPNYGKPLSDSEKKKRREVSQQAFQNVVDRLKAKYGDGVQTSSRSS